MATETTQQKTQGISLQKKRLSGVVVSDTMKDTAVVLVSRFVKHPKYKKYLRRDKRFKAHNAGNTARVGEKVVIEECRPLSKDKHFRIVESEK